MNVTCAGSPFWSKPCANSPRSMKRTPLPKRGQIPKMMIMVPETSTISVESLREKWMLLWPDERNELLASLNRGRIDRWTNDWRQFSYLHQKPPASARGGKPWTTWLILGGRGAGKTRAGAEWVRGLALGDREYTDKPVGRIALVGETEHDVREVMIEGVSGLLHVHNRR